MPHIANPTDIETPSQHIDPARIGASGPAHDWTGVTLSSPSLDPPVSGQPAGQVKTRPTPDALVSRGRMSRENFYLWAEAQPSGKFQRIDGEVFRMAPQRSNQVLVKGGVYFTLRLAAAAAGVRCQVYQEGMTIAAGESDFVPDAILRLGDPLEGNPIAIPDPAIVVEILSPSTRHIDLGLKRAAYFTVPSVRHYLILEADWPEVWHYFRRGQEQDIETRTLTEGEILLDPPGISITVAEIYQEWTQANRR